jgi:hydrogenase nickel incorporation protein HypA/HybF
MHEIAIAQELSAIVLEAAGKENLSKVTRVSICIGKMVQIVPDIFSFAFREAAGNSIADGAVLDIEVVEVRMLCRNCGNAFTPGDNMFSCNVCNSSDTDIMNGRELFIKSIEGE